MPNATTSSTDSWHYLSTILLLSRDALGTVRVRGWSESALSGPSKDFPAYLRVLVTCEDCNGSGIVETEYAAHSCAIEPSYHHSECEFCNGDGEHASDLDGPAATLLWDILTSQGKMAPEVQRAAELAALAHQAEHDEALRLYAERNSEAAQ